MRSLSLSPKLRTLILPLWAVLIACVVVGSLLPAANPVMVDIGRLHISDKVMHFGAYLALSLLPVIRFRDRRRGLRAGLSMFLLGILMEAGQQFSPGRAVELGDVLANGAGVSCGALLGLPIRTLIALICAAPNSLLRGWFRSQSDSFLCDPPGRRCACSPRLGLPDPHTGRHSLSRA